MKIHIFDKKSFHFLCCVFHGPFFQISVMVLPKPPWLCVVFFVAFVVFAQDPQRDGFVYFVLFWCVFSLCLVFLSSSFPKAFVSFYLSTNSAGWSNKENWVCSLILFWEFPFF